MTAYERQVEAIVRNGRTTVICLPVETDTDNGYRCYKPGPIQYFIEGRQVSRERFYELKAA